MAVAHIPHEKPVNPPVGDQEEYAIITPGHDYGSVTQKIADSVLRGALKSLIESNMIFLSSGQKNFGNTVVISPGGGGVIRL